MGKIERAIKALEALPPERQDEIADMIFELMDAVQPRKSVLTEDQLAEVQRRRESGFRPADPSRIDKLIARLK